LNQVPEIGRSNENTNIILVQILKKIRKDYLNKKWKNFYFLMTNFKKFEISNPIGNKEVSELEHQVGRDFLI